MLGESGNSRKWPNGILSKPRQRRLLEALYDDAVEMLIAQGTAPAVLDDVVDRQKRELYATMEGYARESLGHMERAHGNNLCSGKSDHKCRCAQEQMTPAVGQQSPERGDRQMYEIR